MSWTRKIAGWTAGRLKGEKARKKTMDWMEKTGLGKALSIGGDIGIGLAGGKLAKMGGAALKGMFAGGSAAASSTGGTPRLPFDTANAQRQNLLPNDLIDANPVSAARERAIQGATERINQNIQMRGVMGGPPGITGADIARRVGAMGEDVLRRGAEAPAFGGMGGMASAPDFAGGAGQSGGFLGGLARGAASAARGGGSTLRNLLTNPQVIAGAAGGVADVMGQRAQQRIEEQRMAQQGSQFQQQFDVGEEERRRQREQANRLAAFFMPRAQG